MIRHVAMWQLLERADAAKFRQLLDGCRHLVPGMREFEVGLRSDAGREGAAGGQLEGDGVAADVVLVAGFSHQTAFDAYLEHPHRRAVAAQLARRAAACWTLDHPCSASANPTSAAAPPTLTAA